MRPVLFELARLRVFSYTAAMDAALLVGLVVAVLSARRRSLAGVVVLEAGLWAVLGGLVGARAHFVLANWAYFREAPSEILRFWNGGFAFGGGLASGAVVAIAYARLRRLALPALFDAFAPGLAAAQVLGWIGCLLAGSTYGRPGRGPGTLYLPDIYGLLGQRYATQLLGAAVSLLLLVAVFMVLARARRPGWAFAAWLAGTCACQFALEFSRGDDTLMVGALRLGHVTSLIGLAAAAGLVVWLLTRPRAAEPTT